MANLKVVHVLDSLELNGGTSMCLNMASAMRGKFLDWDVSFIVVSKTGHYGRKGLTAESLAKSFGWSIPSMKYDEYDYNHYRDYVVIHHRLDCTKPLKFSSSNRPPVYIVVNHTNAGHKLDRFQHADRIVSVCDFLRKRSRSRKVKHAVILNGVLPNTEIPSRKEPGYFISGRCHRLVPGKFSIQSVAMLDRLGIKRQRHYVMGPPNAEIQRYLRDHKQSCLNYLGKITDVKEKMRIISSFDIYLYDTYCHEGASVAILESLSAGVPVLCKGLGGNSELVKHGVNGYLFRDLNDAGKKIQALANNRNQLELLQKQTMKDFNERLSIYVCIQQYRRMIEKLLKKGSAQHQALVPAGMKSNVKLEVVKRMRRDRKRKRNKPIAGKKKVVQDELEKLIPKTLPAAALSFKDTKFSILTATYNCVNYVTQMIQSVMEQSHSNWEFILLDDQSTDGTYEKARAYVKNDKRIRIVRDQKKRYCGGSYSKLLSLASGEFCGVLDGDDKLVPESIATIIYYYRANPTIDFIWTANLWFNKKMTRHRNGLSRPPKKKTIYDSERGLVHVYSHWRTFRTYLREKGQLFNRKLKCTVDKDLGYRLEEVGYGGYLNQVLYHYRYHPANMSHHSKQRLVWAQVRNEHKANRRYRSVVLS